MNKLLHYFPHDRTVRFLMYLGSLYINPILVDFDQNRKKCQNLGLWHTFEKNRN